MSFREEARTLKPRIHVSRPELYTMVQQAPEPLTQEEVDRINEHVRAHTIRSDSGEIVVEPNYWDWWVIFNESFTWHLPMFDSAEYLKFEIAGRFSLPPDQIAVVTTPMLPSIEEAEQHLQEAKRERDCATAYMAIISPDGSLIKQYEADL